MGFADPFGFGIIVDGVLDAELVARGCVRSEDAGVALQIDFFRCVRADESAGEAKKLSEGHIVILPNRGELETSKKCLRRGRSRAGGP